MVQKSFPVTIRCKWSPFCHHQVQTVPLLPPLEQTVPLFPPLVQTVPPLSTIVKEDLPALVNVLYTGHSQIPVSGFLLLALGFSQMMGMSVYNSLGRDSVNSCFSTLHLAPSTNKPRMQQPCFGRSFSSEEEFFKTLNKAVLKITKR